MRLPSPALRPCGYTAGQARAPTTIRPAVVGRLRAPRVVTSGPASVPVPRSATALRRPPKEQGEGGVAVQIVERWILAALRHRTFLSLAELNARDLQAARPAQHAPVPQPSVCPRSTLTRGGYLGPERGSKLEGFVECREPQVPVAELF